MRRRRHENVATVLVAPAVLRDLELALMAQDMRLWPVATAPIYADGPRRAEQLRRRLILAERGGWDLALNWVPVWVSFGECWRDGEEPLPWAAHQAVYDTLDEYADQVRYHRGLDGVPLLRVAAESHA